MGTNSRLQRIAVRAAARMYGLTEEEVQAAIDNPETAELIGFSGFDWMGLVMQMLQLLLESLQNCQARPAVFQAIRKPGLFARAMTRNRSQRIFAQGNPKFVSMAAAAVTALEDEAAAMNDEDIALAMSEVQNPNPYMVV